ncbi:MAG: hypothetical protein JSR52_05315 [Planctomycetes bacterium]|nr:hypothetical protein [Planctomycetota bacterium]
MKVLLTIAVAISAVVSIAMLSSCSETKAAAGPTGGDIVPIQNGTTKAEVVTNADTGEVIVHTWDQGLRNPMPIDSQPMTLGSGDSSLELMPHPLASDPPGKCSRVYGQADWMRGGSIKTGWLRCCGGQGTRQDFPWTNCWSGGRTHGQIWTEMGEHRRGMGGPMGPGRDGHR